MAAKHEKMVTRTYRVSQSNVLLDGVAFDVEAVVQVVRLRKETKYDIVGTPKIAYSDDKAPAFLDDFERWELVCCNTDEKDWKLF